MLYAQDRRSGDGVNDLVGYSPDGQELWRRDISEAGHLARIDSLPGGVMILGYDWDSVAFIDEEGEEVWRAPREKDGGTVLRCSHDDDGAPYLFYVSYSNYLVWVEKREGDAFVPIIDPAPASPDWLFDAAVRGDGQSAYLAIVGYDLDAGGELLVVMEVGPDGVPLNMVALEGGIRSDSVDAFLARAPGLPGVVVAYSTRPNGQNVMDLGWAHIVDGEIVSRAHMGQGIPKTWVRARGLAVAGSTVYVLHDDLSDDGTGDMLQAYDLATGERRWGTRPPGGGGFISLYATGLAANDDGVIVSFYEGFPA